MEKSYTLSQDGSPAMTDKWLAWHHVLDGPGNWHCGVCGTVIRTDALHLGHLGIWCPYCHKTFFKTIGARCPFCLPLSPPVTDPA